MTSNWLSATTGASHPRSETMQAYVRSYTTTSTSNDQRTTRSDPSHQAPMPDDEPLQDVASPKRPPPLSPGEEAGYRTFLLTRQHRKLQRHDLATRDTIWSESLARARARLHDLNNEKAALEGKIMRMEGERERYKVVNAVGLGEEADEREMRRWEEWLRVERGVDVRAAEERPQRRGEEGEGGEEDEGGVEI